MFRSAIRTGTFVRTIGQRKSIIAGLGQTVTGKSVALSSVRLINTTDKQKDTHHHSAEVYDPEWINSKKPRGPRTAEEFADVDSQKNWISYGFDYVNKDNDRLMFHSGMFCFITMGFVVFCYGLLYYPDFELNDWSLREAFLELDRRERNGLPLIDKNLVDPAKLVLPTDEELGEYEIYL